MSSPRLPVPELLLRKLRAICLGLPEAREEAAWTGTRWCVGNANFAHVLTVDAGWPPHYARAAGTDGPACLLTFRYDLREFDPRRFERAPYFRPVWFANIAGLRLDAAEPDWDEVEPLLIGSYCVLAPKRLASLIDRPRR